MKILDDHFDLENVLCFYNNVSYATFDQPSVCVVVTYDEYKQIKEHILRQEADIEKLAKDFGFIYHGNDVSGGVSGELAVNRSYVSDPNLFRYLYDNAEFIQEPKSNPEMRAIQHALVSGQSSPEAYFKAVAAFAQRQSSGGRKTEVSQPAKRPSRAARLANIVSGLIHRIGCGGD